MILRFANEIDIIIFHNTLMPRTKRSAEKWEHQGNYAYTQKQAETEAENIMNNLNHHISWKVKNNRKESRLLMRTVWAFHLSFTNNFNIEGIDTEFQSFGTSSFITQ